MSNTNHPKHGALDGFNHTYEDPISHPRLDEIGRESNQISSSKEELVLEKLSKKMESQISNQYSPFPQALILSQQQK